MKALKLTYQHTVPTDISHNPTVMMMRIGMMMYWGSVPSIQSLFVCVNKADFLMVCEVNAAHWNLIFFHKKISLCIQSSSLKKIQRKCKLTCLWDCYLGTKFNIVTYKHELIHCELNFECTHGKCELAQHWTCIIPNSDFPFLLPSENEWSCNLFHSSCWEN